MEGHLFLLGCLNFVYVCYGRRFSPMGHVTMRPLLGPLSLVSCNVTWPLGLTCRPATRGWNLRVPDLRVIEWLPRGASHPGSWRRLLHSVWIILSIHGGAVGVASLGVVLLCDCSCVIAHHLTKRLVAGMWSQWPTGWLDPFVSTPLEKQKSLNILSNKKWNTLISGKSVFICFLVWLFMYENLHMFEKANISPISAPLCYVYECNLFYRFGAHKLEIASSPLCSAFSYLCYCNIWVV